MASEVEICNMALSQVRRKSINSLSEASTEAQQCNLWYATARDQVMTEIDWGFNTKLAALAELSLITIFNWAYVWQYPSDCLHINRLIRNIQLVASQAGQSAVAVRYSEHRFQTPDDLPPVEFKVMNESGTKVIVTNESVMRAEYRVKTTDPNLWPMNTRVAISQLLASYIAVPLAGAKEGRSLRTDALGLYNAWVNKAADQTANERYQEPQDSEYIRIREQ